MNGTSKRRKKGNVYRDPCGLYRRLTTYPTSDNWLTLRNYWWNTYPFPGYEDIPFPGIIPTDDDPMPTEWFEKAKALWEPYLGRPYCKNGKSPPNFDCSGLVGWVYKTAGIMQPDIISYTYSIVVSCDFVQSELLEDNGRAPGDILYWSNNPGPSEGMGAHVAIYIGNNYCIESSYNGVAYGLITAHKSPFWGYYRVPRPYPGESEENA